jgi:hypothetical protein
MCVLRVRGKVGGFFSERRSACGVAADRDSILRLYGVAVKRISRRTRLVFGIVSFRIVGIEVTSKVGGAYPTRGSWKSLPLIGQV